MTLLEERGLTESHDACQQRDEHKQRVQWCMTLIEERGLTESHDGCQRGHPAHSCCRICISTYNVPGF